MRVGRPRTALGLTAVLILAVVFLDAVASTASYLTYRGAPPRMPAFEADEVRIVDGTADAYSPMPSVYGFSTTALPPNVSVDDEGRLTYAFDDATAIDPDANAGYALAAIDEFRQSGERAWLERAATALDQVLDTGARGLYPHDFVTRNDLHQEVAAGWYSAQTQGLVLSATVRLAQLTGDRRWRSAAERTFSTFLRFRSFADEDGHVVEDWVSFVDNNSFLWFEVYPSAKTPTSLVSAHDFALIGIYDYWRTSRSEVRRETARRLFVGGVTTLLHNLTILRRPGEVSASSPVAGVRDLPAHRVVVEQTELLARVSDNAPLARLSSDYASDVVGR